MYWRGTPCARVLCEDLILLYPPSALLGDEHARILTIMDPVDANDRVAAREDRHARACIAADVVVLDQPARVVAHKDADALGLMDL